MKVHPTSHHCESIQNFVMNNVIGGFVIARSKKRRKENVNIKSSYVKLSSFFLQVSRSGSDDKILTGAFYVTLIFARKTRSYEFNNIICSLVAMTALTC